MYRLVAVLVTSTLLAAGCTAHTMDYGLPSAPSTVEVVVANEGADEIVVELTRAGIDIPLGTVRAREIRRFALNPAVLGAGSGLALSARSAIGATYQRSVTFDVAPGDRVEWAVETRLRRSALSVR